MKEPKVCGSCYARKTIPDKTIQEFKIVTTDVEKVYVHCTTNSLRTFIDFIQYVLDGAKAEDFYIIEVKSGKVFKLLDLANLWGFRKRTLEEKLKNVQTVNLSKEVMR